MSDQRYTSMASSAVHGGGIFVIWVTGFLLFYISSVESVESVVLKLDHTNFSQVVSQHDFIIVQFYNPWCKHCKNLAPEYEKAAAELSRHDPPIVLAKVNVREEANQGLKARYEIQGVPAMKMFRNGGNIIQEYKGTRQANTMIPYLIKEAVPSSSQIKSMEDIAAILIAKKKIFVVGIFQELSGEEYKNFTFVADKMRNDYDFGHTLDPTLLPHAQVLDKPIVRLLKPFDELFEDSKEFEIDELEMFIRKASLPLVTIFDDDENNYDFVTKFLEFPFSKAMLFVNFSTEHDDFRSLYNDSAVAYKGDEINFLMGDIDISENVLQFYQVKKDQGPLIIIQNINGPKYIKTKVAPNEVAPWLKDYMDDKLEAYKRSQPIPEDDDKLFKDVVLHNLEDMVFKSEKTVLLQFYSPMCRDSRLLMRTLDEVALAFQNDQDVLIAKLDATANDVPMEVFYVEDVPKLFLKSAKNGNISEYNGDISKESIIDLIQKNRAQPVILIDFRAEKEEL